MKDYRTVTFDCCSYDDMMNIYHTKYEKRYQLIGYRLRVIGYLQCRAELILFERRKV